MDRNPTPIALHKLRQAALAGQVATPVGRIALASPLKHAVLAVEPRATVKIGPHGFVPLIGGQSLPGALGVALEPFATSTDAWLAIAAYVEQRA